MLRFHNLIIWNIHCHYSWHVIPLRLACHNYIVFVHLFKNKNKNKNKKQNTIYISGIRQASGQTRQGTSPPDLPPPQQFLNIYRLSNTILTQTRLKYLPESLRIFPEKSWKPSQTERRSPPSIETRGWIWIPYGIQFLLINCITPLSVGNDVIVSWQFPELNHYISSSCGRQMVIWRKISYNWRLVNNFVMQKFHLIFVLYLHHHVWGYFLLYNLHVVHLKNRSTATDPTMKPYDIAFFCHLRCRSVQRVNCTLSYITN